MYIVWVLMETFFVECLLDVESAGYRPYRKLCIFHFYKLYLEYYKSIFRMILYVFDERIKERRYYIITNNTNNSIILIIYLLSYNETTGANPHPVSNCQATIIILTKRQITILLYLLYYI